MKKLKFILSTLILFAAFSSSYASIVVMGGATSVETNGNITIISCGDNPQAICAVIEMTPQSNYMIEPDHGQKYEAISYKVETLSNGRNQITTIDR